MPDRRRLLTRENVYLLFWATVLGLAVAGAFGAYQAVSASDEDAGGRFVEFATGLLWPGTLIFAGVATAVFVGWKANLD